MQRDNIFTRKHDMLAGQSNPNWDETLKGSRDANDSVLLPTDSFKSATNDAPAP